MRMAVVCYPTYGGSGVVATELAIELAHRGHEVHVVSYETPFRLHRFPPGLFFHKVEVDDYPLFRHQPYVLNLTNKLIEMVEKHDLELIHTHYAIPHAEAAWMAREVLRSERGRDVRLACTLHGTDITLVGRLRSFHALTRFTINQQDCLTAPSVFLARDTEQAFAVPADTIAVIPNFVDLTRFQPAADPLGLDTRHCLRAQDRFLVTHVSNFRPVKRVKHVVRAFACLRERHPAVLALVGEGPDMAVAERLADDLGIRDDLRMLGHCDRLEDVLQASDAFLLPSRSESFGLAALEALACGCPVFAYRVGGLPEVVENEVSGVLCDDDNPDCLGKALARVLEDPPRLAAMRVAARQRAEIFAPGPVVDRYEAVLSACVAR